MSIISGEGEYPTPDNNLQQSNFYDLFFNNTIHGAESMQATVRWLLLAIIYTGQLLKEGTVGCRGHRSYLNYIVVASDSIRLEDTGQDGHRGKGQINIENYWPYIMS